jgi:hypothetical protein
LYPEAEIVTRRCVDKEVHHASLKVLPCGHPRRLFDLHRPKQHALKAAMIRTLNHKNHKNRPHHPTPRHSLLKTPRDRLDSLGSHKGCAQSPLEIACNGSILTITIDTDQKNPSYLRGLLSESGCQHNLRHHISLDEQFSMFCTRNGLVSH